ncbi:MAG: ABC transporter permease [Acidimicrobiales bacterium]
MTATTYDTKLDRPAIRPVTATTFFDTARAEWTKLRTLRSTWFTIGGAAAASVAMAGLICAGTASQLDRMTPNEVAELDPTSQTLVGALFAALIIGSLAVRTITSENSNGMIRVTFSAIPGRRGVLAAKAAILAVVVFPVALVANIAGFLLGSQILSSKVDVPSITDAATLEAIVLGAVAVSLVAVIGLGLGGILRHTAGATTALSVGLIGSGLFGLVLPESARQYLPGTAMEAMTAVKQQAGVLSPAMGLVVLAAYAIAAYAVAVTLIVRRDA